jgi:hypothetical protein
MAAFTITIRDEALKTEIGEAFADQYANPDSLTDEELVVKHIANFVRGKLNEYREKQAVEAAKAGVNEEDTLE